jgi:hypothetical protein
MSGNNTRTAFNRFSTEKKNRCARNITYHKDNAIIWDLKSEWWGSSLAQEEKCQGKECLWYDDDDVLDDDDDDDDNNNNNNNNSSSSLCFIAQMHKMKWVNKYKRCLLSLGGKEPLTYIVCNL